MKLGKNLIAAMGLAAATYFGSPKETYADAPYCDVPGYEAVTENNNNRNRAPHLRSGDTLIQLQPNENNAQAIRRRFARRNLSDTMVRNIEAEALRNERRNYNLDPCDINYLIIPSFVFNRPRQATPIPMYGLTPEDRNAINETRDRVNELNGRITGLDERVGQLSDDLNQMRQEEANDHTELINKISNRTRDIVRSETDRAITDRELRERRQRAAESLRAFVRERNNFVSLGYGWMVEDINSRPYGAGHALFAAFSGARPISGNLVDVFARADARLVFEREFDSERNLRSFSLGANAGLRLMLKNKWLGVEGYMHFDDLSAVIFDNAGDVSVDQFSIGPGAGFAIDTRHLDANLGMSYNVGENDITMENTVKLGRLVLDARILYQPNPNIFPAEFYGRYRLLATDIDAEGVDRSSVQHDIVAEAFYRPNLVPGLAAGVHVEEIVQSSEANDSNSMTIGGILRYDF